MIQNAQSRMNWALYIQTWKYFSLKDIIWHLIYRYNSYHSLKSCILFHYVYIKNYLGALDFSTFQKLQFIFSALTGKVRFPLRPARIKNVFLSPGIKNMLQAVQKREVQIFLNSRWDYILINPLLQDTEYSSCFHMKTIPAIMHTLLYFKWITNRDLLYITWNSVMWQPEWEGGLRENGYMYMCGWIPSLFTWNYHNIVNQLCPNTKKSCKTIINGWVHHKNKQAKIICKL